MVILRNLDNSYTPAGELVMFVNIQNFQAQFVFALEGMVLFSFAALVATKLH